MAVVSRYEGWGFTVSGLRGATKGLYLGIAWAFRLHLAPLPSIYMQELLALILTRSGIVVCKARFFVRVHFIPKSNLLQCRKAVPRILRGLETVARSRVSRL